MTTAGTLPKSLTQADFQLIADHCYHVARKIVRKGRPVISVVVVGAVGDHELLVKLSIHVPLENDHDKETLTCLMQALAQHPELDFVAHISEAWMAPISGRQMPQGSLANHPKRQEVVIFNIMSKDCQTVVINPLRRNPPRLKRGKLDFSVEVRGRMVREPEVRN